MSKLSELVRNALSDAEVKIASARDAAPEVPETKTKVASAEPVAAPASTEKRAGVVKTAARAVEIAAALDNLGMLMPKIASGGNTNRGGGSVGPQDRPGPAITSSPQMGATRDSNTKAQTLSHQEASSGGGPSSGMHLHTNKSQNATSSTVKGAALSREAAEQILLAKVAQVEALRAAGNLNEALKLASQAQADFERSKKAYEEEDDSTRLTYGDPKTMPASSSSNGGAAGGVALDNQGMINFTKRDGKARERGAIAQHVSEPAFSATSDRGIQDNVQTTTGAKIASVREKIAAKAREKKADVMVDEAQVMPAAVGGLVPVPGVGGAYVGYQRGKGQDKALSGAVRGAAGEVGGGVLGAITGGVPGAALGGLTGAALARMGGGDTSYGAQLGARMGGAVGGAVGGFAGRAHGMNMATRSLLPQDAAQAVPQGSGQEG
jgi:hypothetical protein